MNLHGINVAVHKQITVSGLARLLASASNLDKINLKECKGLLWDSSDTTGVFALASALTNT